MTMPDDVLQMMREAVTAVVALADTRGHYRNRGARGRTCHENCERCLAIKSMPQWLQMVITERVRTPATYATETTDSAHYDQDGEQR
jgi:hypothetical protein